MLVQILARRSHVATGSTSDEHQLDELTSYAGFYGHRVFY
jgi:hypothetical protein